MQSHYPGLELEAFARARKWKSYLRELLQPHISGDILEVGAGIGATTAALYNPRHRRWLCLEPDLKLAVYISDSIQSGRLPSNCEVISGTLDDLPVAERFHSILYVDVLEHIDNDKEQVEGALKHLHHGGRLIVVAPAHQFLYSPFDAAVGHCRRYDKQQLTRSIPAHMRPLLLRYIDCVGFLLAAANRIALHKSVPTMREVAMWDRWAIPISRCLDPLLGFACGKTVVGVWQKSY